MLFIPLKTDVPCRHLLFTLQKNLESADLHSKVKARRAQNYKESTMQHEIKRDFCHECSVCEC